MMNFKFRATLTDSFHRVSASIEYLQKKLDSDLNINFKTLKNRIAKVIDDAKQNSISQFRQIKHDIFEETIFPTQILQAPSPSPSTNKQRQEKLMVYLDRIHKCLLLLKYFYNLKFNVHRRKAKALDSQLKEISKRSLKTTIDIQRFSESNSTQQLCLSSEIQKLINMDIGMSIFRLTPYININILI